MREHGLLESSAGTLVCNKIAQTKLYICKILHTYYSSYAQSFQS